MVPSSRLPHWQRRLLRFYSKARFDWGLLLDCQHLLCCAWNMVPAFQVSTTCFVFYTTKHWNVFEVNCLHYLHSLNSEVYTTLLPRSIWSKPLATPESPVDSWLSRDLWLWINNGKWEATLNTDLSCINLCKSLNDIILVWWSLMITLRSCSGVIHLQYHEQKTDLFDTNWWFVHIFCRPSRAIAESYH